MKIKAKLRFYEKLYFHELERRESIDKRLRLPFAIFAIVFGFGFFLLKQLHNHPDIETGIFFWISLSTSAVTLALSIIFFILSWYSYTYRVLPNAISLENYYKDTLAHYQTFQKGKASVWTNEAFKEYLLDKFQEYASYNAYKNDKKSYRLYISTNLLIVSFIFISISYYPLVCHFL